MSQIPHVSMIPNDTMTPIESIVQRQTTFFMKNRTKSLSKRLQLLEELRQVIKRRESEILRALYQDLNKAPFEGYATEVGLVLDELRYVIRHLKDWAKPKRVPTPMAHFWSRSTIYSEPYGVALIMAPWNYPFLLSMAPLIGAVAAGNCVILKPSDYSKHTSLLLKNIVEEVFEDEYVSVVLGGREENQSLLEQRFDYIFFTGSTTVGKLVMESASRNLTPVSLELGGKSPCIVDETADLKLAAKRIVWGKFVNAGQTCVAPDYLYVQRSVRGKLVKEMKHYIGKFYGESPCENPEFPKIINPKHFARLCDLMKGESIVIGGMFDERELKIAPTLLEHITWDSPVMQEEIFGPILPILEFDSLDEVIAIVKSKEKPLALYLFTTSKDAEKKVRSEVSYGGGCINDTIVHLATPHMPFGGVGYSGMGGYHGKYSFDTFSHKKSILKKSNAVDVFLRYPPYKNHLTLLKKMLK